MHEFELEIPQTDLHRFLPLLQAGFWIKTGGGQSIEFFLKQHLLLDMETIDRKIKTVFLNNSPVDDLASAIIDDQDVLAFSGAMPGLVGTTLIRGGHLAAMRDGITHRPHKTEPAPSEIMFQARLFNLLIKELGARFLKKGILFSPKDNLSVVQAAFENVQAGNGTITVNGKPVPAGETADISIFEKKDLAGLVIKIN